MDSAEVYLDHAASTPMRAGAREAWLASSMTHHANPTGAHNSARAARRALDDARDELASAVGRSPAELVFTSGGSEADNLAVRGVLRSRGGTAVCSAGEHHAVLEPVEHSGGFTAPLGADGRVDPDGLATVLGSVSDVSLVSLIAVNNETGAINDLPLLAEVAREHAPGALLHTDAVQAMTWLDVASVVADYDLVSITGHKLGGPVGTGCLFVRAGIDLDPLILGGGQERGRRAGTPDVGGALAFAAAVTAVVSGRDTEIPRLRELRDRLVVGLAAVLGDRVVATTLRHGHERVVAGIAHVCFPGIEAEALLYLLDEEGIRASAASSCSSGAQDPSHVLAAMGVPREVAQGSLRLSLGHSSTDHDIDAALSVIPAAVARLAAHRGG